MSGVVQDLIDEWTALARARAEWEKYWRTVAKYVLPQTEGFDTLIANAPDASVMSVVSVPVASKKSKDIYDMTSLWGIDRLTSGILSLKTPESDYWHDVGVSDLFGYEPEQEELQALERVRNYLFRVRGNPRSGFWSSHRASLKSMCAFGDGWQFLEDMVGAQIPFQYTYVPLPEVYPGMGPDGRPNRMSRVFSWSADQIARKWPEHAGKKVVDMANDPMRRHNRLRVMHSVRPRSEAGEGGLGVRGSDFASFYSLPDENHLIAEGGFYDFPYIRYAWANTGHRPFSEGPVAFALAEIQSLQEMGKNELIAAQAMLRPPMATHGKNFTRLNFNPGAPNPGLISGDGKQLFAPLNTGARPDFAQAIIETRRNSVRETLYLNLWQILLDQTNPDETATQAMIRAQEKGEMLGPVGISLNSGLSQMVDREIGILNRKRAFDDGSPLALPDSLAERDVSANYTSPLDRLRRMGELVGMQRLVEFVNVLVANMPPANAEALLMRLDPDEMLEKAQHILGAPASILRPKQQVEQEMAQQQKSGGQAQQMAAMMEMLKQGGDAAKAVGDGGSALAAGAAEVGASPSIQNFASRLTAGAPAQ